jgi:electron transport complex protein RnfB
MDAVAFSKPFVISASVILALVLVYLLSILVRVLKRHRAEQTANLAAQIDQLLPQTQCRQCGYNGCRPYADAMVKGEVVNRCPPGGEQTIRALAELLDVPVTPLDSTLTTYGGPTVAVIREAQCIGCTKCIQACPVDAILGAPKLMHTVITGECTGCDLCRDPCPVDCIDIVPLPSLLRPLTSTSPEQFQLTGAGGS